MTCQFWSQEVNGVCNLHSSDSFSLTINIVSAVLVLIGIFFDVLVLIFVGTMAIYGDEGDAEYRMIPMQSFNDANGEEIFRSDGKCIQQNAKNVSQYLKDH